MVGTHPMAKFTHNAATHSVTGKFPFSLIMGYKPQSHLPLRRIFLLALEQWLNQIEDTWEEAEATHKLTHQCMKEQTFAHFKSWKVGDKVWLKARNLKLQISSRKLSAKWTGPFEITQVISSNYLLPLSLGLLDSWWHPSPHGWTVYFHLPIVFYIPPSSRAPWPTRHSVDRKSVV